MEESVPTAAEATPPGFKAAAAASGGAGSRPAQGSAEPSGSAAPSEGALVSSLAAGEVVEIHSGADGRDPHQQESGADDNPQPVGFRCEMESALARAPGSPGKKRVKLTAPKDVFETITAAASKEISKQFSKFAKALNDRAAVDASRMKELEGILAEARDLESYLKEKKQHLRQMLAVISDKLQG